MADIRYNPRSQRIEVNIADQFPEIKVFLANDRFKPILKKGAVARVTAIESDHISGQQSCHDLGKACGSRANQEVGVVGQKCPGITRGLCGWKQICNTIEQIVSVLIVPEYIPALYSTNDDVVQHTRSV